MVVANSAARVSMHVVLSWRTWLMMALFVSVAFAVVAHLVLGMDYVSSGRGAAGVTSFLALVFTSTPAWRLLWILPAIREKAPLLDGTWTGEIRSNWSIVTAIREAAKQAGADAIDLDRLDQRLPDLSITTVEATMKSSFFNVSMALKSGGGGYQNSRLSAVVYKPASDGHPPVLHYLFQAQVLEPKAGDVACFEGAGSLTVTTAQQGEILLDGSTWTNRSWARGLNTAGVVRLRKL